MKKDLHPAYNEVKFTCSCGNIFTTGSTLDQKSMNIEVCSKCHPFYTGKQKVVMSDRIQRFKEKYKTKTSTPAGQDSGAAA